jgi:hypothetical protein
MVFCSSRRPTRNAGAKRLTTYFGVTILRRGQVRELRYRLSRVHFAAPGCYAASGGPSAGTKCASFRESQIPELS